MDMTDSSLILNARKFENLFEEAGLSETEKKNGRSFIYTSLLEKLFYLSIYTRPNNIFTVNIFTIFVKRKSQD